MKEKRGNEDDIPKINKKLIRKLYCNYFNQNGANIHLCFLTLRNLKERYVLKVLSSLFTFNVTQIIK